MDKIKGKQRQAGTVFVKTDTGHFADGRVIAVRKLLKGGDRRAGNNSAFLLILLFYPLLQFLGGVPEVSRRICLNEKEDA